MSETRHRYVVRMEAEGGKIVTSQLESMAAGGKKSFDVIEGSATRVDSRLNLMATTVMTRLVPALSASALGAAIHTAIKDLADLKDASEKVGISAEKLQVFRYLGEDVGIGAEAAEDALAKFVRGIGEAQMGTGKLLDTLERYNIQLKDNNGQNRDALDILDDLADVISRVEDEQVQLAIAQKAFGDGGAAFVAALREGSAGLKQYEKDARESGQVIDEELINRADQFDHKWEQAMRSWSAGWKSATLEASIAMIDFINEVGKVQAMQREALGGMLGGKTSGQDLGYNVIPDDVLRNWKPTSADTAEGRLKQQAARLSKTGFPVNGNGGALTIETRTKQQIDAENKAKEESARLSQKEADKTREVIAALQFRNEQVQRNERDQELYNQLKAAGVDIDTKEGQQIQELVGQYYQYSKAQEKLRQELERNERVAKSFGDAISSAFSDAIVEGESLSDVIGNLGKDIERMLFKEFIGDPLSEGVADFIKDIIPFGGFKAEGGPLEQNKWYVAGEYGPEAIWGGGAGAFAAGYPQGGGGGSNVAVNVFNNSSASVDVKQSKNGNEQRIEVVIDEAVARAIGSPSSKTSRALKSSSVPKTIRR